MNTTTQSKEKPAPVVLPVDLRDYFAAKAMQALIQGSAFDGTVEYEEAFLATNAYVMADAMLKAREQ